MPLPPIPPSQTHDIAVAAMQGLLFSDSSRRAVFVTAKKKEITFNEELAIEAYDIADAIIVEAGNRP